ncbi:MAG TPA: DUF2911 domain-containing protein [Acidobacteriota bacterium]|nr:DUF2911 domain-containing protein [Acidobacteriota bacterium]
MKISSLILLASILTLPVAAQSQQESAVRAFGGSPDLERASTRVVFFDTANQRFLGEVEIAYGRPEWRQDYEDSENFDAVTEGKQIRFGKNFWASLDTNVPLKMNGLEVGPGLYYLGISRNQDDEWHLLLFDPARVRAERLDASQTPQAAPAQRIPMTKSVSGIEKEELTVSFSYDQSDPGKMSLRIEWGPHQLTAPVIVDLGN